MRSTDFEFMVRSERKQDHYEDVMGVRSPFTRGRALDQHINIEQLPVASYLPIVQDPTGGGTTGAIQIFYFCLGYSRLGGPDVLR